MLYKPSDKLLGYYFDFTVQLFHKVYWYQEQGAIRPIMEMINTKMESVAYKFKIHMMRYYGIQRIIQQTNFFSCRNPICRMVWQLHTQELRILHG